MFDISLVSKAYHLRREETDWFDKPRESRLENGHGLDRKLPERLVHSRPLSQHQEQVSAILSNLLDLYKSSKKKITHEWSQNSKLHEIFQSSSQI